MYARKSTAPRGAHESEEEYNSRKNWRTGIAGTGAGLAGALAGFGAGRGTAGAVNMSRAMEHIANKRREADAELRAAMNGWRRS